MTNETAGSIWSRNQVTHFIAYIDPYLRSSDEFCAMFVLRAFYISEVTEGYILN